MAIVAGLLGYTLLVGAFLTPMLDTFGIWITLPVILVGWFVIIGVGANLHQVGRLSWATIRQGAGEGVTFFGTWTLYMVGMFLAAGVLYVAGRALGFYAGAG